MSKFINTELESESESELEPDTELDAKLESDFWIVVFLLFIAHVFRMVSSDL